MALSKAIDWLRGDRRKRSQPQWRWQQGAACPAARVEAGRVQIGPQLFVFGGYMSLSQVTRRVDLYDLANDRWQALGELPEGAPETHAGLAHDGARHILMVSGQSGPHCSPASPRCFSFDVIDHRWHELPPLPKARYMPLVHHLNGRLYCLSGTREDRSTPASECWSLGVEHGRATEARWRREPALPSPRNHTASLLIGHEVLVFGGQQSDIPPIPGDELHRCDFPAARTINLDECYAYGLLDGNVRPLAPLPVKLGHTDQACVLFEGTVIIAGGTINELTSDLVFLYDLQQDRWRQYGRLPYPMKSKIAACWNGRLFLVAGQRAKSARDLRPHEVLDTVWHATMPEIKFP